MTPTITRSTGTPVGAGGVIYGMAGGGYRGYTEQLDAVVREAAGALAHAYGADIEIRFNSDRESGGAWLKTPDGYSAHVGICASVVSARNRAHWQVYAERYEREADTGRSQYNGRELTPDELDASRELAAEYRSWLDQAPEGQLTVFAHITGHAAGDRAAELAALDGWNERLYPSTGGSYHHGAADSVADALARCAEFAPSERMRQDAADLARWESDGGA